MSKELSKTTAIATTGEADVIKSQYVTENIDRFNKPYQESFRERIMGVEVGAMYYSNSDYNAWTVYLVENITIQEPKRKKDSKEFIVHVKIWDWKEQAWGPLPDKSKGYEYIMGLDEFSKAVMLPKLTKHPIELIAEAELALKTGDMSKYELDQLSKQQAEGPDTQLMHMGSKASLEAIHRDVMAKKNHLELLQHSMEMVIAQKMRELEKIKDKLNGTIAVLNKQIKKIFRVITTLELYLGIEETIIQIQEGMTAPVTEPISIRQGIMFMDEEVGDPWDDGLGIEWTHVKDFDQWLTRNENYKKVLPELKGMAAFKCKREQKKRSENPYVNMAMGESDHFTFLLIRNGDNLYRLITEKIEFYPRLFPRRQELQDLFELWTFMDDLEKKNKGESTHIWSEDEQRLRAKFKGKDMEFGRDTAATKELAEDNVFFYKMRMTLFQGILERTQIFEPTPEPIKLFDNSSIEKGLVRLIFDDELTLPSGRPTFWQWLEKLNSTITYGSRIILSHNWNFRKDFNHSYIDSGRDLHNSRLDDRFQSDNRYNMPKLPNEGLYYVKMGERYQNEPLWIENPNFDESKYVTKNEVEWSPEDDIDWRGNKREHLREQVMMSYTDQIKFFGKIVAKDTFDHFNKNETNDQKHGQVWVDRNPRKIQKYTNGEDSVIAFQDGKASRKTRKSFHYQRHDVKYNFMCIRYNPKDKIEREGWTWKDFPEERKLSLSWKIYNSDAFVINYDDIKIEDIDFYLTSRVDRREYIHIMPLLWEVKKQLVAEAQSEVDFKRLVQGQVLKDAGYMPSDEAVDQAVEEWKKNLKWKRAIHHDDEKALRMIVKRLSK